MMLLHVIKFVSYRNDIYKLLLKNINFKQHIHALIRKFSDTDNNQICLFQTDVHLKCKFDLSITYF